MSERQCICGHPVSWHGTPTGTHCREWGCRCDMFIEDDDHD